VTIEYRQPEEKILKRSRRKGEQVKTSITKPKYIFFFMSYKLKKILSPHPCREENKAPIGLENWKNSSLLGVISTSN